MIKELPKKEFKGFELKYAYKTNAYYDVNVHHDYPVFSFTLKRKLYEKPQEKSFDSHLFETHLDEPSAFGYFIDDTLEGVIQLNYERYNKRLRIADLLVFNDTYRRHHIGTHLMNHAKMYAKSVNARAIVLETQSCNTPAIDFYMAQGFNLIGLDTNHYTNNDIQKNEVRLEFGFTILKKI